MKIRKVVIPVAGWGTRSLPASKNIPKEMLPIYNKPVIQHIVEEAKASGVQDVIFVSSKEKKVIEDHFDYSLQLEEVLARNGKEKLLKEVREVAEMVNVMSVRQKKQLGLGHALLCAEHLIGDEFFGLMLGDDTFFGKTPGLKQLAKVAKKYNKSVLALIDVPPDMVDKYGIIAGKEIEDGIVEIDYLVEKPKLENAPSNKAIVGRYVLSPKIFEHIKRLKPGHGGEIQLTDALNTLCKEEGMLAIRMQGTRFDAGDWVDYIAANVHFALKEEGLKSALIKKLKEILADHQ